MRLFSKTKIAICAAVTAVGLFAVGHVYAADVSADSLKLAKDVTPAPAYETGESAKFKAANTADVLSGWQVYTSKPVAGVKAGEPVEVLAKVKNYDWYLVGKNGQGIGYLPRSLLMPAS